MRDNFINTFCEIKELGGTLERIQILDFKSGCMDYSEVNTLDLQY